MILLLMMIVMVIVLLGYQEMIVQRYTLFSKKIHQPVKIALMSDLHGTIYGHNQSQLISKIHKEHPDIIIMAGDMIDEYCDTHGLETLLQGIKDIPCYYVLGNHESQVDLLALRECMNRYGVCMIGQKLRSIKVKKTELIIAGLDDPMTFALSMSEGMKDWQQSLIQLNERLHQHSYSLFISHRPSLVKEYEKTNFDLIVSGHAHGGQWRIPHLLNGLIAPDEGLFPRYAGGMYCLKNTQLIVSRGLVKNLLPRFFNPPELVMIELRSK